MLDRRLELGAADPGGQSPERGDQIVGQRIAHLGEPLIAFALFGSRPDVARGQHPQPDVEGELPKQRGIDQIGHPAPPSGENQHQNNLVLSFTTSDVPVKGTRL